MSNLRSAYPQAQAWTFLIDTPPPPASDQKNTATPPSGGAGATAAAGGAAGASGRIRPALAAGVTKSGPNKGSGLSSNHSSGDGGGRGEAGGTEEMGAMCSKPNSSSSSTNNTLDNKENMGEAAEEMPPNGTDQTTTAGGNSSGGGDAGVSSSRSSSSTGDASPEASGKPGGESIEEGEAASVLQGTPPLDSTASLSPDPEEERAAAQPGDEVGSLSAVDDEGVAVAGLVRGGHAGSNGDGRMEYEDRSAWVARNVGMLPRGGQEVEVDKLRELPGLENCLHELLSERERHLSAMENLTSQLRRREAEATKASHDLKAVTARLECAEQDRSGLERRVRAAAEEHRVERARWFVHKQELETRCVQLESRDTQYRASMRKKELEYGRLQDSLRRTVEKSSSMTHRGAGGKGGAKGRGIESNLELSPGDTATEGGSQPLGGVLNEQAAWKAEELEAQNSSLRSMLIDLQGEVMDLKGYQDRHGDLVSAGRGAAEEGGIWGGRMSVEPLPAEVIEGMPADWLERQFGDEMARQIKGMRGALARVLGDDENEAKGGDAASSISQEDMTSIVSQLREARALLREQDAIMFAAIFDRPGAGVASEQHACVCGGEGGSGVWDSLERLEQEREELEQERSKLEKDKAKFLEEAVRRDSKSFVFSYPSASPTPGTPVPRDSRYATPVQLRGRQEQSGAEGARDLTVATTTPPGANGNGATGGGGVRDAVSMPLMTFTPPTASPHTTKLLGQLGINL
ncbi:unnamed protein product [Scytosiphon promiscuus]